MIIMKVIYINGNVGTFEFETREHAEHILNHLQESGMWDLIKGVQIEEED